MNAREHIRRLAALQDAQRVERAQVPAKAAGGLRVQLPFSMPLGEDETLTAAVVLSYALKRRVLGVWSDGSAHFTLAPRL